MRKARAASGHGISNEKYLLEGVDRGHERFEDGFV